LFHKVLIVKWRDHKWNFVKYIYFAFTLQLVFKKSIIFEEIKKKLMKKVILFGAFALLTLASCKKDWTCTCTSSVGGSSSTTIQDMTKSDAKADCDGGDGSALGITVDCEIQ
jgi:hypothetical protein